MKLLNISSSDPVRILRILEEPISLRTSGEYRD